LLSELRGVPLNVAFAANDKLAHLALYSVLGAALSWAWFASRAWPGRGPRLSHALLIGLGLVNGVADEVHQAFVPNRMPSVADWVADAVGVVVGYALATFLIRVLASRWSRQASSVSS